MNVAVVWFVGLAGLVRMVTFGASLSRVKVRDSGVGSVLPTGSRARTEKVCCPSASDAGVVYGLAQVANAWASMAHWNVAPGSGESKLNVACFFGPSGPLSIVVSGASVSTVKVRSAGEASRLPDASLARTWRVCRPSGSCASVSGLLHAAKAPTSTAHSKVAPGSFEWNVKVGVLSAVSPAGPESMVVSGAVASIVQPSETKSPTLPAASVARTSKVWWPSARPG